MLFGGEVLNCFVCGNRIPDHRTGVRLNGDGLTPKRKIALERRRQLNFGLVNFYENSRLCFGCSTSINQELCLAEDLSVLRLNVVQVTMTTRA